MKSPMSECFCHHHVPVPMHSAVVDMHARHATMTSSRVKESKRPPSEMFREKG